MSIQVIIDQAEIEAAIRERIASKISFAEGQNVTIDLKAGRGENGFTANIVIGDDAPKSEAPTTETKGPTVTGPFKRGPKTTAQPAPEAAQANTETTSAGEAGTDAGAEAEGSQSGAQEATSEAPQGEAETAKPKGLFAHLGNRTGTDKAE